MLRRETVSLPTSALVLLVLGALAALSVVLFMVVGARGDWGFLLAFRGTKVATMILVGTAIAVSTGSIPDRGRQPHPDARDHGI